MQEIEYKIDKFLNIDALEMLHIQGVRDAIGIIKELTDQNAILIELTKAVAKLPDKINTPLWILEQSVNNIGMAAQATLDRMENL